jgi:flagellar biosynthetic protein FliO
MGAEAVPSYGWALLRMVLALLFVCALAYLALRFGLRRLLQPGAGAGRLRVVDRCPLAAGRSLWIIEVDGQQLLIGECEGGLSKLAELEPVDPPVGQNRSFFEVLRGRAKPGGRREL